MSLMRCVCCGVVVDTDYDVETFPVGDVCADCMAQEQEQQNAAALAVEEEQ